MDKRLEDAVGLPVSPPELYHLCVSAVLYARRDFGDLTPEDTLQDFLNFHLANVLYWGYTLAGQEQIARWDSHQAQMTLLHYRQYREVARMARRIGDQALFIASQDIHPHVHSRTFRQSAEAVGQMSYLIVSANTSDRKVARPVYFVLGSRFGWFSQLLGHAGVLLGMTSLAPHLINPPHPLVTINDFLEALAEYGRHPDHAHWETLRQMASDHKWIDPDFNFELPAEPSI